MSGEFAPAQTPILFLTASAMLASAMQPPPPTLRGITSGCGKRFTRERQMPDTAARHAMVADAEPDGETMDG